MSSSSRPSRRVVLAGAAAVGALSAVSVSGAAAQAAATAPAYRWRTAVIGGTGFVTGVLFHPSVRGLAYARTDIGGAYRWDERAARWTPLTDHLGWDDWNLLGVEAIAVDPAHPDRVYLSRCLCPVVGRERGRSAVRGPRGDLGAYRPRREARGQRRRAGCR